MACWINSIRPSSALKKKEGGKWRDNQTSKIFHIESGLVQDLAAWLQDAGSTNPTNGNLLVIPYNRSNYSATREQIEAVADLWEIPTPILELSVSNILTACPSMTVTGMNGTSWAFLAMKPEPDASDLRCRFGTYQPSRDDITVSFALESDPRLSKPKCLVFCPTLYRRKVIYAAISAQRHTDTPGLFLWNFLLLLVAEMEFGWRMFHVVNIGDCSAISSHIHRSRDTMLSTENLAIVDNYISRTNRLMHQIGLMMVTLQFMDKLLNVAAKVHPDNILQIRRIGQGLRFQHCKFRALNGEYSMACENLRELRINASTALQLNNAKYTRANTVALRRLQEQNHFEAKEVQSLARQSAQGAGMMRRLTTLAMLFLPSTVVAAFFPTPFMAFDEYLHFKALPKAWILFLTSAILTLLTFALSSIWDLLQRQQQPEDKEAKADETLNNDSDRVLLGPAEALDPGEMLADMLNIWDSAESETSTENKDGQNRADADDDFLGPALSVGDGTQEVPRCSQKDVLEDTRQHIVETPWGDLQLGDCPQGGDPGVILLDTEPHRGSDGGLDGHPALREDGVTAQDDQNLEREGGRVTVRDTKRTTMGKMGKLIGMRS